jgi:hypothetical protein
MESAGNALIPVVSMQRNVSFQHKICLCPSILLYDLHITSSSLRSPIRRIQRPRVRSHNQFWTRKDRFFPWCLCHCNCPIPSGSSRRCRCRCRSCGSLLSSGLPAETENEKSQQQYTSSSSTSDRANLSSTFRTAAVLCFRGWQWGRGG